MAILKHDATVGRILLIDANNPPDLTAEEFLSYMDEGLVPIAWSDGNTQHIFNLCGYTISAQGSVLLTAANSGAAIATFPPAYTAGGSGSGSGGGGK